MQLKSPVFNDNGEIPVEFSCEGLNARPPLEVVDLPAGTLSWAIAVDDPDAPSGNFVHWFAWNIPRTEMFLAIGLLPHEAHEGTNDFGVVGYGGPCPPTGEHRYHFAAYALDTLLDLPRGASRADFEQAIKGHVLEEATLVGRYSRHQTD